MNNWRSRSRCGLIACALAVAMSAPAFGQNPNQFGGQDRADAATQLILVAVERATASLPPTSGPSVTFEFDPASDAFHRSTHLGPTVLRSAQTIGAGVFSLQLAASYFEMSESFRPVNYLFTCDDPQVCPSVAKLGLNASARVSLVNISATYGLSNRVELSLSLPLTVIDAHAAQVFSIFTGDSATPANQVQLGGVRVLDDDVQEAVQYLDHELQPGGDFTLREDTFRDLGFHFNEGTHAGVGRIGLSSKVVLLSREMFQAAGTAELLLPSPSESAFAGAGSVAILPRLVATLKLNDAINLHSDVGYQHDFDNAELRRFTWRMGGSLASGRAAFDLGIGGSEFGAPVAWTPSVVHGGVTTTSPAITGTALEDTTVGTTVVDLLLGVKLRVNEAFVIAGGVSVPVITPDFQPEALGTIAVELCF